MATTSPNQPVAGETSKTLTWQAQKSAATQKQVLDAAVACFVELGYANTTTTKIAERAGLSRGAMLHHYPSKQSIVRAAIDYLHDKRLRAFRRTVAAIAPGADRLVDATKAYWQQVTNPLFFAFLELKIAARTDTELAEILRPAEESFTEEWIRTARDLFPDWETDALQLGMEIMQSQMDGLAVNQLDTRSPERAQRVLEFLVSQIRQLEPLARS